mmetsp:Transcript_118/g.514  ORF Transcript_118/g.514 Transcript_118/m.514 type:complete len:256 (-) Transcript_118:71-838(-)
MRRQCQPETAPSHQSSLSSPATFKTFCNCVFVTKPVPFRSLHLTVTSGLTTTGTGAFGAGRGSSSSLTTSARISSKFSLVTKAVPLRSLARPDRVAFCRSVVIPASSKAIRLTREEEDSQTSGPLDELALEYSACTIMFSTKSKFTRTSFPPLSALASRPSGCSSSGPPSPGLGRPRRASSGVTNLLSSSPGPPLSSPTASDVSCNAFCPQQAAPIAGGGGPGGLQKGSVKRPGARSWTTNRPVRMGSWVERRSL